MSRYALMTAIAVAALAAEADIPDYSLEWERFLTVGEPRVERILGSAVSGDGMTARCVALTPSGGLLVAEAHLGEDGAAPSLDIVAEMEAGGWTVGCMPDYDRVAAVGAAKDGTAVLLVCDAGDLSSMDTLELEGVPGEAEAVEYLAMEPLGTGAVLVGGVSETGFGAGHFLIAADIDAGTEWTARLPVEEDAYGRMELCALEDGGAAAAVGGWPPSRSFSVHRIGPAGASLWSRKVEVDADCTVGLNRLAAMPDGGILCIGEKGLRGESVHGMLILLGPDGDEVWRAEPWYLDHSALHAALPAGRRTLLLCGWMAMSGPNITEVGERDVLLASLDPESMELTGARLEAAGQQVPGVVVPCDDGAVVVLGIDGGLEGQGRLFVGRALLRAGRE